MGFVRLSADVDISAEISGRVLNLLVVFSCSFHFMTAVSVYGDGPAPCAGYGLPCLLPISKKGMSPE